MDVKFDIQHPDLIRAVPSSLILKKGTQENLTIEVQALRAGSVILSVNATPSDVARLVLILFFRFIMKKSRFLDFLTIIFNIIKQIFLRYKIRIFFFERTRKLF